jgi:hypothetical protein
VNGVAVNRGSRTADRWFITLTVATVHLHLMPCRARTPMQQRRGIGSRVSSSIIVVIDMVVDAYMQSPSHSNFSPSSFPRLR